MSCTTAPCPPAAPSPQTQPSLVAPTGAICTDAPLYYNTSQTYVDSCSAGSPTPPISVTVQAFTFSSSASQMAADNLAMNYAQSLAQAMRSLSPCQPPPVTGNFLVTETTDFIIAENGDFITT